MCTINHLIKRVNQFHTILYTNYLNTLPIHPPINPPYENNGNRGIDDMKILAPPKHPIVIPIKLGINIGIKEESILEKGMQSNPNPAQPITNNDDLKIPFLVLICSYPYYYSTTI